MVDLDAGVAVLHAEIDAFYAGFGDPAALEESFRAAVLLVPVAEGSRVRTSEFGGVEWICAFTSAEQYARWLSRRGELDPAGEYPYHAFSGWRLADYVAGCVKPTGVTVDIAGPSPMAFPPTVTEAHRAAAGT
ncbi:hypothetical protein IU474_24560 [Nocardia otitidiscaviarum]|uniref:hypothetical protein n=1 Tax=Nocardia otitidiscaviarum TaxID=1823 RepID=UPI0018944B45|nr:hypothetical protein [Nocardia otitidiscaviarum]MBF6240220.1 hypothetical protein [Nocardia otitidiscaviarum]